MIGAICGSTKGWDVQDTFGRQKDMHIANLETLTMCCTNLEPNNVCRILPTIQWQHRKLQARCSSIQNSICFMSKIYETVRLLKH